MMNESDLKSTDFYGFCERGNLDMVKLMLKSAKINSFVNRSMAIGTFHLQEKTPLYVACEMNHVDIVSELLKSRGIQLHVNKKRSVFTGKIGFLTNDDTPLHVATSKNHQEIVRLLLSRRDTRVDLKNKKGKSALEIAKKKEIREMLVFRRRIDQGIVVVEEQVSHMISEDTNFFYFRPTDRFSTYVRISYPNTTLKRHNNTTTSRFTEKLTYLRSTPSYKLIIETFETHDGNVENTTKNSKLSIMYHLTSLLSVSLYSPPTTTNKKQGSSETFMHLKFQHCQNKPPELLIMFEHTPLLLYFTRLLCSFTKSTESNTTEKEFKNIVKTSVLESVFLKRYSFSQTDISSLNVCKDPKFLRTHILQQRKYLWNPDNLMTKILSHVLYSTDFMDHVRKIELKFRELLNVESGKEQVEKKNEDVMWRNCLDATNKKYGLNIQDFNYPCKIRHLSNFLRLTKMEIEGFSKEKEVDKLKIVKVLKQWYDFRIASFGDGDTPKFQQFLPGYPHNCDFMKDGEKEIPFGMILNLLDLDLVRTEQLDPYDTEKIFKFEKSVELQGKILSHMRKVLRSVFENRNSSEFWKVESCVKLVLCEVPTFRKFGHSRKIPMTQRSGRLNFLIGDSLWIHWSEYGILEVSSHSPSAHFSSKKRVVSCLALSSLDNAMPMNHNVNPLVDYHSFHSSLKLFVDKVVRINQAYLRNPDFTRSMGRMNDYECFGRLLSKICKGGLTKKIDMFIKHFLLNSKKIEMMRIRLAYSNNDDSKLFVSYPLRTFEMSETFRKTFSEALDGKSFEFHASTHPRLDSFASHCFRIDPDFQVNFGSEFFLLRSFDTAFWMNWESHKNQPLFGKREEFEPSKLTKCGCPFTKTRIVGGFVVSTCAGSRYGRGKKKVLKNISNLKNEVIQLRVEIVREYEVFFEAFAKFREKVNDEKVLKLYLSREIVRVERARLVQIKNEFLGIGRKIQFALSLGSKIPTVLKLRRYVKDEKQKLGDIRKFAKSEIGRAKNEIDKTAKNLMKLLTVKQTHQSLKHDLFQLRMSCSSTLVSFCSDFDRMSSKFVAALRRGSEIHASISRRSSMNQRIADSQIRSTEIEDSSNAAPIRDGPFSKFCKQIFQNCQEIMSLQKIFCKMWSVVVSKLSSEKYTFSQKNCFGEEWITLQVSKFSVFKNIRCCISDFQGETKSTYIGTVKNFQDFIQLVLEKSSEEIEGEVDDERDKSDEKRLVICEGEGILFKQIRKNVIRILYEGEFSQNMFHGRGIQYSEKTGEIEYEGQFFMNKREGRGDLHNVKDKSIISAMFQNGNILKKLIHFQFRKVGINTFTKFLNSQNMIGRGGNGNVYKCVFEKKKMAIKIFFVDMYTFKGRLMKNVIRRSLQICASLDHKNICRIYGMIEGRGKIGMMMELAETSVDKFIDQNKGRIMMEEKISMLHQTAKGMAYIHSQNIVNRDLKWGNVLKRGKDILLTDFDTMREDSNWKFKALQTKTGIGTSSFLAPEVLSGNYSLSVDVFSFGMMVYCLLLETNNPYVHVFHCSCGAEVQSMNPVVLPIHVRDCGLRPRINPHDVHKKFGKYQFLIRLMILCWNKDANIRPTFQQICDVLNSKYISKKDTGISRIVTFFFIEKGADGSQSMGRKEIHHLVILNSMNRSRKLLVNMSNPSSLFSSVQAMFEDCMLLKIYFHYLDGRDLVEVKSQEDLEKFHEDCVLVGEFDRIPSSVSSQGDGLSQIRMKKVLEENNQLKKKNQELNEKVRELEERIRLLDKKL